MSKFPYTYAADFIREHLGAQVSRASAAALNLELARILEVDYELFAAKLAGEYQAKHSIEASREEDPKKES